MSCGGPLSSVMMIAGAGMIPGASALSGIGSSLGVSSALTGALGSFNGLGITSQFSDIISSATGVLSGGTLDSLRTLGADIFPALTNAIPGDFASALGSIAPGGVFDGGFTGLVGSMATNLMGAGDITKFAQIFNGADGFLSQANQFINSGANIGDIAKTFGPLTGGMDNLITGSFSQVSQAFGAFGGDLSNLGNLIDMKNLENLGNPAALVKQLTDVGGLIPSVENVLRESGLSSGNLGSLISGNFAGLADNANALLYDGMTKITGRDLQQVTGLLGVTTPGINSMADLLNPTKILPNSFATLTMPTPDGLRGIYATTGGAVNTNLEKYFTRSLNTLPITNDLIGQARSGLPELGSLVNTTVRKGTQKFI